MVANKNPLYKASNQGIDRSGMVLPAGFQPEAHIYDRRS